MNSEEVCPMKKFISIFLCGIIVFVFSACSAKGNIDQNSVNKENLTSSNIQMKNSTDSDEDYLSMYKSNQLIMSGNMSSYYPIKAENGKYYFFDQYSYSIYELTASEFVKSCGENKLFKIGDAYEEQGSYWEYGKVFYKFPNDVVGDELFIQVYKNYIYVSVNSEIYKINCDDSDDVKRIYQSEDNLNFFFYDDEIFVLNQDSNNKYTLSKGDLSCNNIIHILNGGQGFANARDDEIYNIYVSNGYLYFVLRADGFESNTSFYCRCKIDGSEKEVWKINDGSMNLAVNENCVAAITNNYDENNNFYGLNVEVFDSKDLSQNKAFTVDFDENAEAYSVFNEGLFVPALFNQNSIEFDICGITLNISDFNSKRIMIDTNNETISSSSYSGLIVRTDLSDLFSYDNSGNETEINLYYYKIY